MANPVVVMSDIVTPANKAAETDHQQVNADASREKVFELFADGLKTYKHVVC